MSIGTEQVGRRIARKVKVLIVDDHALFRNLLVRVLEAQPELQIVGEAGDGEAALKMCINHEPDIVLLDLEMPGMDGIQVLIEAKTMNPAIRFIVLTSHLESPYVFEAIKAGTSGYLSKDTTRQKLMEAIDVVLGGEALFDPQVTMKLLKEFLRLSRAPQAEHLSATTMLDDGTQDILSNREKQIVAQVGKGKINQDIAKDLFISINTVKKHIANILKKLKLADRVQIALYATRWGYVD